MAINVNTSTLGSVTRFSDRYPEMKSNLETPPQNIVDQFTSSLGDFLQMSWDSRASASQPKGPNSGVLQQIANVTTTLILPIAVAGVVEGIQFGPNC